MTIIEAAKQSIKELGRPSTAQEIYNQIVLKGHYRFGAKNPLGILRSELQRHNVNFQGKTKSLYPCLQRDALGRYLVI